MNFWSSAPFLRICIPFALGIIYTVFNDTDFSHLIQNIYIPLALLLLLFLYSGIQLKYFSKKYGIRWIWGITINILLFICGILFAFFCREKYNENHYSIKVDKSSHAKIIIKENPKHKEDYIKIIAEIAELYINQKWYRTKGKAVIKITADSASKNLKYGDCLIVTNEFRKLEELQNPGEINYVKYLHFNDIYYQAFFKEGSWKLTKINYANKIVKYSYQLQHSLIEIFRKYIIGKGEVAVASALIIGYTEEIDNTLRQAYSVSGVMHVLSVSGMHVGIIYLLLSNLLFFMDKNKYLRFLKSIILLSFLWFYALLTGLSPAVLRAAIMLSLVIIAKIVNRETSVINILMATAFILILVNPMILFSIGFQLSFLAVAGIVLFQNWFYELIDIKNVYLDKIWNLTSVSLAAQLSTFPLGIYYFNQFPNYFIIANLVDIPLATLIMYLCIALLFFSAIPIVATYIGIACYWLIYLLNQSVITTEKLPGAVANGISPNVFQTILIYLLIFLFFKFTLNKKSSFLYASLFCILILLGTNMYDKYSILHRNKLIVYNIKKSTAIDLIQAQNSLLIIDTTLGNDTSKMNRYIFPGRKKMQIENTQTKFIYKNQNEQNGVTKLPHLYFRNNIIRFKNKIVFIFNNKNLVSKNYNTNMNFDYLIISGNVNCDISKMVEKIKFKKIIIDSSNSLFKTKKWSKECELLQLDYHAVLLKGPFIADLN